MERIANRRFWSLALLSCIALSSNVTHTGSECYAQGQQPRKTYVRNKQEFAAEMLSSPVDLPGVPAFTGQTKFVTGMRSPNAKGGEIITLHYSAKQEQKEVLAWYVQAAKNFHWSVDERPPESPSIAMNNGSAVCTIAVTNPSTPGYRSDIIIMFRATKK